MYKEKIILFSTGLSAERFYYEYYDKIEIEFCLDNHEEKQLEKFHGISIYSLSNILPIPMLTLTSGDFPLLYSFF